MNSFLKTFRLVLTPLSPIHIGMGEDFEPTNYIIDADKDGNNGILYAFDPARALLSPELRGKLLAAADSGRPESIHSIYALLAEKREAFIPVAHDFIPVSAGIARKYRDSLGKVVRVENDLRQVYNSNALERTMRLAGDGRPYLPGSSVKGAIRTAWLEAQHKICVKMRGTAACSDEKDLLQGNFQTSPMRLLKIADGVPQRDDIDRRIMFACNYKKQAVMAKGKMTNDGKGPSTRKEVILSGQYRAFVSELTLVDPGKNVPREMSPQRPEITSLARYCNAYYRPRLDLELDLLREGTYAAGWLERLHSLLKAMQGQQDNGAVFLLRLGRFGDAETKTIRELARIKIMGGKGQPPRFQKNTTTLWLAAEQDKQRNNLLPFGWAVVEINPQGENEPLRRWCEEERKGRPDMRGVRERAAEHQARLAAEKAAREQAEAERRAKVREVEEERVAKERELAALSAEQKELREFCRTLENRPPLKPTEAGAAILSDCLDFLEKAKSWQEADRRRCAEQIAPLVKKKNMLDAGKKGRIIKETLKSLRG
jgi:CRISPR-associated protein Csm5